jgi:hypothetical protein
MRISVPHPVRCARSCLPKELALAYGLPLRRGVQGRLRVTSTAITRSCQQSVGDGNGRESALPAEGDHVP